MPKPLRWVGAALLMAMAGAALTYKFEMEQWPWFAGILLEIIAFFVFLNGAEEGLTGHFAKREFRKGKMFVREQTFDLRSWAPTKKLDWDFSGLPPKRDPGPELGPDKEDLSPSPPKNIAL